MPPGSVAPRTVHSVRPGSTTTWPTCRDVTLSYFSNMDLCSTLPSSPFLFQFFQMLSSDSPGTLSLSAKITKLPSFLVTLQALSLSFLPKSPNFLHNKTANHTCNATATDSHMQLRRCQTYFPRLPLLPGTLSPTSAKSITQQWVTGISTLQWPLVSA